MDFFEFMFMLPFNLAMIYFWIVGWEIIARRWFRLPAAGAKVWDDGFCLRVRLPEVRPLLTGCVLTGVLAVASLVAVGLPYGPNPPMPIMLGAWGVVVAGGLLAYGCHHLKLAQGGSDLVIDYTNRSVSLPRILGRKEDVVIPLDKVTFVMIDEVFVRTAKSTTCYYAPTIVFTDRDNSTRFEKIAKWLDESRAVELAAWLRKACGIGDAADRVDRATPADRPTDAAP